MAKGGRSGSSCQARPVEAEEPSWGTQWGDFDHAAVLLDQVCKHRLHDDLPTELQEAAIGADPPLSVCPVGVRRAVIEEDLVSDSASVSIRVGFYVRIRAAPCSRAGAAARPNRTGHPA